MGHMGYTWAVWVHAAMHEGPGCAVRGSLGSMARRTRRVAGDAATLPCAHEGAGAAARRRLSRSAAVCSASRAQGASARCQRGPQHTQRA